MNHMREEAEKLRDAGYSYRMIKDATGVPISTMSYWFKDKPFVPNKEVLNRIQYGPIKSATLRHNERVKNILKQNQIGKEEIGLLTRRDLWILGIGLYIGEGSKNHEQIRIINSDPAVIKLAVRWFIDICGLTKNNLAICLHIYPDSNEQEAITFWSQITDLPKNRFLKSSVDKRESKKTANRGKLPYGTVHLRVNSNGNPANGVILYRKISGWMNGVLEQA